MLLSSSYLAFKPSQVAAAALILSININGSECSQLMGAPTVLQNLHKKAFYFNLKSSPEEQQFEEGKDSGPLKFWNSQVE